MPVGIQLPRFDTSGAVLTPSGSPFSAVRDATNGSSVVGVDSNSQFGVGTVASRSSFNHQVSRLFLGFDTASVPNNIIAAKLYIYGRGNNNPGCQTIVVKASKPGSTTPIATTDYRAAIVGFVTGSSMAGNVTDYSGVKTTWLKTGYNDILLNAAARAEIGNPNSTIFQVAVLNYQNDYLNVAPGSTGERFNSYIYATDSLGNKVPPLIEITYGLGLNVNDVQYTVIREVNDIGELGIYQINGVNA
jgi:hypothetical protein